MVECNMLARNAYQEFSDFFGDSLTMLSVWPVYFIILYLNKMFKLECIFH
jgi:hypothetical protein